MGLRLSRLEDDDRDLALGALLIVVVRGPLSGHRPPELWLLLWGGVTGVGREALVLDLHLDARVSLQVLVPGRRRVRAALRGDHQIVVPVAPVDQRGRLRLTGAPAGGSQEEGVGALPVVALLATSRPVALDVLRPVKRHTRSGLPVLAGRSNNYRSSRSSWPIVPSGNTAWGSSFVCTNPVAS